MEGKADETYLMIFILIIFKYFFIYLNAQSSRLTLSPQPADNNLFAKINWLYLKEVSSVKPASCLKTVLIFVGWYSSKIYQHFHKISKNERKNLNKNPKLMKTWKLESKMWKKNSNEKLVLQISEASKSTINNKKITLKDYEEYICEKIFEIRT